MDIIPYSDLRANLAETLKQLELREEPVFISRRGEPTAVLMSVAQYQRLSAGASPTFWDALCAWRERHADVLASPEAEDDPFAKLRDPSADGGRAPVDFDATEPPVAPRRTGPSR